MTKLTREILSHTAVVQFEKEVCGWFNGSHRRFEFTPRECAIRGRPGIKWESWVANFWFVTPVGRSVKAHFAVVKRKLKGKPAREIRFVKKEGISGE